MRLSIWERAEMNEYVLLLSKPPFVEFKNTTIFLGRMRHISTFLSLDSIDNLLYAQESKSNDTFTVVLDAGHGGKIRETVEISTMKSILF
ncbi:MAG: hypothetical protein CM15mP83_8600 [Flavobacteriaceae bacterium]|nr:MAG: hypothetical protein CM15mP83_8600 [Flavobacteriaceae bacterium]